MRKTVFTILMIIWMVVIFLYSSRGYEQSISDSHEAGKIVGGFVLFDFSEDGAAARMDFSMMIEKQIRKCAHVMEYVILGIFAVLALASDKELAVSIDPGVIATRFAPARGVLLAYTVSVIYAASDEFHQLFVPGRAGLLSDVAIDSIGVMIGIAVTLFLYNICSKNINKS